MDLDLFPNGEHASVSLDGIAHEVTALVAREAVSSLFQIDVTCAPRDDEPAPEELLGRKVSVTLRDGHGGHRKISGIVAEAELRFRDAGKAALAFTMRPSAFRLTLGRDSRVFHDATVVDIVGDVLARGKVRARWEVARDYAARVYTAQYREADWTFVSRLLEEEGIYHWFDEDDDGEILVLGDRSPSAPDLVGGARIRFAAETGMRADVELVEELGPVAQVTPTAFRLAAFDPERPALEVKGQAGDGPFAHYDAPGGGTARPELIAARATTMREAAAVARSSAAGRTTSARLVAGRPRVGGGHRGDRCDGRFFLPAGVPQVEQRLGGGAGGVEQAFSCRFRAVPSTLPFRPAEVTPRAAQPALQTGVTVGASGAEVHPDEAGRVRVQLHWDRQGKRDDASGKWMRVAQRGTAASMLLPRVGWNVFTSNEEGSVDAPMVHSRMFDGEHLPPYPLPSAMTKTTFKTATTPGGGSFNEIRYEDLAGSEEMFINASRDMSVLVQNSKTEDVKASSWKEVLVDQTLAVGNNAQEGIVLDQTIVIGKNESETVGQSREKLVSGSEKSKIGGSRSLKVNGGAENSVTGSRTLSVGAAQMDISLGDLTLATPSLHVMVGGALVRITPRNITEDVGMTVSASSVAGQLGVSGLAGAALSGAAGALSSASFGAGGVVQTIGGAKFELAGKTRTISVDKKYTETVGGAMVLKSGGAFTDEALGKWSIDVAGKLGAEAPTLVVEANTIEIEVGGTTLTVDAETGVKISSAAMDLSGASELNAKAKNVRQN